MTFGSVAIAYEEERIIEKHLQHLPDWIVEKVLLQSIEPWSGGNPSSPLTAELAEPYARVVRSQWQTEEAQRNTGQQLHADKDWVIILDPDEFLDNDNWDKLKKFLETTDADAVVVEGQYTYWKDGWVATPPKDYQMLIAAKPHVQFVDKRVVGTGYTVAPVWLHHFSWAKTDEEVLRKITTYAHNTDFDTMQWYNTVWLNWKPGDKNVHPTTPSTLEDFKRAVLPPEIERLDLWPK